MWIEQDLCEHQQLNANVIWANCPKDQTTHNVNQVWINIYILYKSVKDQDRISKQVKPKAKAIKKIRTLGPICLWCVDDERYNHHSNSNDNRHTNRIQSVSNQFSLCQLLTRKRKEKKKKSSYAYKTNNIGNVKYVIDCS